MLAITYPKKLSYKRKRFYNSQFWRFTDQDSLFKFAVEDPLALLLWTLIRAMQSMRRSQVS